MSLTINNNTVVRLIIRRGYDSDRVQVILAEGELGYTIDTQRIFVGDGYTLGGIPVTNKFHGFTTNLNTLLNVVEDDLAYDTVQQALFVYTSTGWSSVSPGSDIFEQVTGGIRIKAVFAGTGFNLANSASEIHNNYSRLTSLELDSRYWALSTANYGNAGGFYIGDTSALANHVGSYRFSIDGPVGLITNGQTGGLVLSGGNTNVVRSDSATFMVNASAFSFNSKCSQYHQGYRFNGSSVTIDKDLNVNGTATINSLVTLTQTSVQASSTFQINLSAASVGARGLWIHDISNTQHILIDATANSALRPVLYCTTTPFVGLLTSGDSRFSSASILLSGETGAISSGARAFQVTNYGGGTIGFDTVAGALSARAASFSLSGGNLTVYGDISATGDLIAYSSSDARLKNNITPLTGALDRLLQIRGVEFDWNPGLSQEGRDVGVIAQEVESVLSLAVTTKENGYKGVRYDRLIPLLIEAIRELARKPQ